jgi:hypothetical protein
MIPEVKGEHLSSEHEHERLSAENLRLLAAQTELTEQDAKLRRDLKSLKARLARTEVRARKAERALSALKRSTSWRITAPLRRLVGLVSRMRHRGGRFAPSAATAEDSASVAELNNRYRELEEQLWGGFSIPALKTLQATIGDPASGKRDRAAASRVLAVWYAAEGAYEQAAEHAEQSRRASDGKSRSEAALLEAYCLSFIGKGEEARPLLRPYLGRPSAVLAMANTFSPRATRTGQEGERDDERLKWINKRYEQHGLATVSRRDPTRPLTIDNIVGAASQSIADGPCISIIMPTFNSAETLGIAVESVLSQSWENLEIIVVDDLSTDETIEVAR